MKLLTAPVVCPTNLESLSVGSIVNLEWLEPILAEKEEDEKFIPTQQVGMYVRQEMAEVIAELTKESRPQRQVLIGSPGVGKSILLFLVAFHRASKEGKPVLYIRQVENPQELTSVFYMTKKKDELIVHFNRYVDPVGSVNELKRAVLQKVARIDPEDSAKAILSNNVLYFLDGLNQGNSALRSPHHYLATSAGYDVPHGETARDTELVVLGGWQKDDLRVALERTSNVLKLSGGGGVAADASTNADAGTNANDDDVSMEGSSEGPSSEELAAAYEVEAFEDLFFHTGGRIREALVYARDREAWKKNKKIMIDAIKEGQAALSLIDTKNSGDPESPDRIRTMFRSHATDFGGALQIVDSQYYVRLLRDRVELDQYYNAYMLAKERHLSSAAGCHFEELLHKVFHKLPKPIQGIIKGTGTGKNCVSQLTEFSQYWIPSIPNFANIDAAIAIENADGSVNLCCPQYTISAHHAFNNMTFKVKFLRPVLQALGHRSVPGDSVCIYFIVPEDADPFQVPSEVEAAGYEANVVYVNCTSVGKISEVFQHLDFIAQPVAFYGDDRNPKRPAPS